MSAERHRDGPRERTEAPIGADILAWPISGESDHALRVHAGRLAVRVRDPPELDAAEIGRSLSPQFFAAHNRRAVIFGENRDELLSGLDALAAGESTASIIEGAAPARRDEASGAVFVFAGQGSQWNGMARELLDSSPVFAAHLRACADALSEHIEWSLEDVLRGAKDAPALDRVDIVQPALFAVTVSLAQLWRACGVHPTAVIGHSQGEIAAAYVAGGLSLQDAALLVARRSQLLGSLSGSGGMVAVALGVNELSSLLERWGERVAIASINGPASTVVSGDCEALEELREECDARGVKARRVLIDYASHSPQVDAIRTQLLEALAPIAPRPGRVPFYSTVTGAQFDTAELGGEYWFRGERQTVRFEQAIRQLSKTARAFIEISPHPVLTVGMQETIESLEDAPEIGVFATLRRDQGGRGRFVASLADLWVGGVDVDWPGILGQPRTGGAGWLSEGCELAPAGVEGVSSPAREAGEERRGNLSHNSSLRRLALTSASAAQDESVLRELICAQAAIVLARGSSDAVPAHLTFKELGFDSPAIVELHNRLRRLTGLRFGFTLLFNHPTPSALAGRLLGELGGASAQAAASARGGSSAPAEPIAIVGMSCRYPGETQSPQELWDLVARGGDAIGGFPRDRGWALEDLYDPDPASVGTSYVREGGFLHDAAEFDAAFFGIGPREALAMDPQQRLLLEGAWEACERAGIAPASLRGTPTGVFAGVSAQEYGPRLHHAGQEQGGYALTGSSPSVASGRVAYALGLEGTAVTVDTACSSSLVALHLACQALRSGECTFALSGGVTVMSSPGMFVEFSRQRGLAPDGRCKPFAAGANGTNWSEGVAVLLLEGLADARRNGHPVLAVVRGSAVNQDGASNGLTAPNGLAQQRVIRQALENAGLRATEVDAVEAHGTGTTLGDPIEADALLETYGRERTRSQPLWVGSVKSNIGHTQAAAGVAGIIKMVMAMRHGVLPRTLHVDRPTDRVDWSSGAVSLLTEQRPWRRDGHPRRAGVSGFGISGTNAHVILEEPAEEILASRRALASRCANDGAPESSVAERGLAQDAQPGSDDRRAGAGAVLSAPAVPWLLSGRTEPALRAQAERLRRHLRADPPGGIADIGLSLAGRPVFEHRAALLGERRDELLDALDALASGAPASGAIEGVAPTATGATAFLFPGQGSQWEGMAVELLDCSALFAERMRACEEALAEHVEWSLEDVLRGAPGAPSLERVDVVQPALFAVMVSLAAVWRALGVQPDVVIGHSQGEIAAAHVAGGLSLQDAARVVALRSRALRRLAGRGGMVSIASTAQAIGDLLEPFDGHLALAAMNGPSSAVVSGDPATLDELLRICAAKDLNARRLPVDYAAHSPDIEALREELLAGCAPISPRSSDTPFLSTVTGGLLDTSQLDGGYWYRNLRETVQLERATRAALDRGCRAFVELSPHPVLTVGVQETLDRTLSETNAAVVVGSLRRHEGGPSRLLASLAEAWTRGVGVSWDALFDGTGARKAALPTYPFQRKRYWLEPRAADGGIAAAGQSSAKHPLLGALVELAGGEGSVFTAQLSTETHPWLEDHAVLDTVLFPGVGFLELALGAGAQLGMESLSELNLQAPLVLPERGSVQLQLSISPPDEHGCRGLRIYSRDPRAGDGSGSGLRAGDGSGSGLRAGDGSGADGVCDGEEWTLHATGALAPPAPPTAEVGCPSAETWPPAGAEPLETDFLYDRLAEAGYGYGAAFRGLRAAWRRGDELFGELALPESDAAQVAGFGVHPALLDAALHPLLPAAFEPYRAGALEVPFSFAGVRLRGRGASLLRVRLRIQGEGVSIEAFDSSNATIISIDSLVMRPIEASTLRAVKSAPRDALFTLQWSQSPVASAHASTPPFAVLGSGLTAQIPHERAQSYADLRALLGAIEDGAPLPELVLTELPYAEDGGRSCGESGDQRRREGGDQSREEGGEHLADAAQMQTVRALELLQSWLAAERLQGAKLVILTHRAVALEGESPDLRTAAMWGLLRSAQSEHPDRFALIDTDGSAISPRLLTAALASREPQLAIRAGSLRAPRLAVAGPRTPSSPATLGARGTVLITGGTGGLGRLLARHLVGVHGVRHLLLASRQGPRAEGASELQAELEALGARIDICASDVSEREQVRRLLGSIPAEHPLVAVVHAAGALDDGVVSSLTPERLRRVMGAKVDSAIHLHELTMHLDDLAAFVLFSSAVGTFGGSGQGNYAAANTFLDALAAHRRAQGLAGTSIAWGLWEQASAMTADIRQADISRMSRTGMGRLSTEQGLELFDAALRQDEALVLAVPLVRSTLRARARSGTLPPLFADLVRSRDRPASAAPHESSARRLAAIPAAEQEGAIVEIVRAQVAVVLGHDSPAAVDTRRTFKELGLDSLAVLELRNRLTHACGLNLPTTLAFEHPSVDELARHLLSRLRHPTQPGAALPQLSSAPAARFDAFPLNAIQQAYLAGRSGAFVLGRVSTHLYCEVELAHLDIERLTRAIDRLIHRHDMLRAVFPREGGQRILATVPPYVVSVSDLSSATADAVHDHLQDVRGRLSHEVRPAHEWPLFEICVTRLPGGAALAHVSLDMLIMDLSSMGLLVRELTGLYQEPAQDLEPVEITFRDYLLAEQQLKETELFERSKRYWMERVPTLPAAPELPLARSPATLERQVVVRRECRIDATRWEKIKSRAASAGVTPSVALMSAFAQVLAYWSKSGHFILNVTTSNRLPLHPRVEEIVGDFTTLELLEVDIRKARGLSALANALQDQLWRDLEHCHFSGIQVIGELARLGDENALIAPIVSTSGLGIDGEAMGRVTHAVSQTPQVLLDHLVFEAEGSLLLSWDSVDEAFPAGMLDDMFDAYRNYLEAAAEQDELWAGEAEWDWLPARQRAARAEIRATSAPVERAATEGDLLHDGFLAQAAANPQRPALIWSEGQMTYADLLSRAADLASTLRERGVQPNSLVGVSVEKGWKQMVAVLGVLMSGGAYLPVDPELPDQRRHYLVEHAGASVVLTEREHSAHWPSEISQVGVDGRREHVEGRREPVDDRCEHVVDGREHVRDGCEPVQEDFIPPLPAADDLAYVIYTSGSTGVPKGVAMTHRAAWNTVGDMNDRFALGPADRVLALSSLGFDLSVYDLFGTLAAGGAVVLPDPGTAREPRHWLEMCQEHNVTVWNSVPALMEMAVQQAQAESRLAASLRLVLLSGDWIPVSLPGQIRLQAPKARIVSLGGATEAAIWSIFHPVEDVNPEWDSIPYGKPLTNQFWEVLNDRMQPCPVHVPGELYIGGDGLAKCYWRDPEKTAASFVTHPRTNERLYRTGDLGRYLPDGNIEFLGREDSQVKIGGHRIELGEIETQLNAHPHVQAAAVVDIGETRNRRRLAAYVVPLEQEYDPDPSPLSPNADGDEQAGSPALALGAIDLGAAIVDPAERYEFKLRRHGLRTTAPLSPIELPSRRSGQARRALHHDRRSHRRFAPHPVALSSLSRLLESIGSIEAAGGPKYRYGSAGGLYPVQAYVAVRERMVDGLGAGAYYYDPRAHTLNAITPESSLAVDAHVEANERIVAGSAFTIILVAELAAIEPLYGRYAERFSLIEAGLMVQLLETEAARCGIGLCQVALAERPIVREALQLRDSHLVIHGLVGAAFYPVGVTSLQAQVNGSPSLTAKLGGWLSERLPKYMIPAQMQLLPELPLTANGKVDRSALRRLTPLSGASDDKQHINGKSAANEPTTHALIERLKGLPHSAQRATVLDVVRTAVADVLGYENGREVESDLAFRELGLSSLQVIELRNRLEETTGLLLPATVIFDHPTSRRVAEQIAQTLLSSVPARTPVTQGARSESNINGSQVIGMDSELAEATADNIFELIDRELGGS